jgi:hypothetical protein
VPALFDHHVLRDPGCNVMGWNLRGRKLARAGDGYLVDGSPLRLFHFCCGFDPRRPERLTTRDDLPWSDLAVDDVLAALCRDYAARLLSAGYDRELENEHGYARMSDGSALTPLVRRHYREALIDAEQNGTPEPANPLEGIPG